MEVFFSSKKTFFRKVNTGRTRHGESELIKDKMGGKGMDWIGEVFLRHITTTPCVFPPHSEDPPLFDCPDHQPPPQIAYKSHGGGNALERKAEEVSWKVSPPSLLLFS
jgi:hypothetical protein